MTDEERYQQDAEFKRGYDAYCAGEEPKEGEPKSQAWHEGYEQALHDSTKGE